MKLGNSIILLTVLIVTGCKPVSSPKKSPPFRPLQNGFGVAAKWVGVDSGPSASLYYKGTNETPLLVWPHIGTHGDPILFTNDVALLLADKPDDQGRLGGGALIAVQGTGPAMDISDDVWQFGKLETNSSPKHLTRKHDPFSLISDKDKLSVKYMPRLNVGEGIPQSVKVLITWDGIFSVMEDVKRTGKTNKVTNTDVLYLQKVYDAPVK